jgi:hypothetical protein
VKEVKRVIRQYTSKQGWKELSSRLLSGGWAVILFPLLAYVGYSLWLTAQGMGSISDAFREYWNLTVVPPWVGFLEFIQRIFAGNLLFVDWVDLILFLVVIVTCIIAIFRLRLEYSIYIWVTLALMFMRGYSSHLFTGFMRYSMTLFPIFWIIPKLVKNRYLEMALLTLSLLVQYLLLWMFLNWYWVA